MTGNFSPGSVATVLSPSLFCLKPRWFARLYGNSFAPVIDHSIQRFRIKWRRSLGCGCVSQVISNKLNDSVNLRPACKLDKPFRFAWYCNGNEQRSSSYLDIFQNFSVQAVIISCCHEQRCLAFNAHNFFLFIRHSTEVDGARINVVFACSWWILHWADWKKIYFIVMRTKKKLIRCALVFLRCDFQECNLFVKRWLSVYLRYLSVVVLISSWVIENCDIQKHTHKCVVHQAIVQQTDVFN